MLVSTFEHDLGGAEIFAAVNEGYLGGKASEKQGFLHGGISAANDHDFFSREEESVTRGTGRNAVADKLLLVGQAQPAGGRAAGDDERLGVHLVLAEMEQEGALAEVGASEVRGAVFGAEALRLLAHILDQLRPHDSFGKSGKIFYQRGEGKLAAGLVAFDDQRLQIGAGGVECGRVSGTAG